MRRRRLTVLILAGGFGLSGLLFAIQASADSSSATVGDAAEAWYNTSPLGSCSSPIGCPPVTAPSAFSYPSGTLHVAVATGQMTATTYIQPDLTSLPAGEQAVSGTMSLPLDTDSSSGSYNPSSATIVACLATKSFPDGTEGSANQPPGTNCNVTAPVQVGTNSFTLKLDPFLAAWNGGQPEYGIALIPDPANTSASSTWHVTFDGRRLAGTTHVSSALILAPAAPGSTASGSAGAADTGSATSSGGTVSAPSAASPAPSAPSPAADAGGLTSNASPASGAQASSPLIAGGAAQTPAASGQAASPNSTQNFAPETAAASRGGFQYPEVMLLPIAFAAGLVFVVRMLTSDATPKRKPV